MTGSRFDRILAGRQPRAIYDSVLIDLGDMVVTPTLGSIVPHWVLGIPKRRADNLVQWSSGDPARPLCAIREIIARLDADPSKVIWFEHGPVSRGSVVGCGIDHAHVHILLEPRFGFAEFSKAAREQSALTWQSGTGDPYTRIPADTSYLVAGSDENYAVALSVEIVGSQFFRRVIASLTNDVHRWDYRVHPHVENAARTVAAYAQRAA